MNNHKRARNRQRETGRSHQPTRRPTGQQNSVSASQPLESNGSQNSGVKRCRAGPKKSFPDEMHGRVSSKSTLRGLYSHPRCCHAVSVMTGCVVQVLVKTGTIYEGILVTVSAEYDVVLEAAHVVEKKAPGGTTPSIPDEIIDKMVFKFAHIVYVKAKDCDIEFATRGDAFLTDTEISETGRGVNGQLQEKELEEWAGDGDDMKVDPSLEAGGDMANGWSAEDMFKTNEEKYGVQTLYDEKLSDYTTPLDKEDTKEYRDRKDRAERLAREIEASPDHAKNSSLESSDGTEEEKYSSVVRPGYAGHGHNSNKYVPPHLRGHSGGNNPGNHNQPPRLRSPQNRQMHNTSQMGRPQSRTPPQAHSPQPPHQVHQPPPHPMMQQGHPMRPPPHPHAHPPHPPHPPHPHPSQLHVHRAPNPHMNPQQRLPTPHHVPHPMSSPRSPQGMHPAHLRTPPHSLPPQQMSPRQPPPPQDHRGSPVSPNQLRSSTPDVIREEKPPYVDVSESSKTLSSINRKTPSSPQPAAEAQSIPTSPGAPTGTENPKPIEDKNIAELKDFSRNFHLTDSKGGSDPKAASNPANKGNPNSEAQSTDKTRTATEALEKKESDTDKSDVKVSKLNPNAKEFNPNPNAKPFVPQNKTVLVHPTKTPTPPRPQSQPSPVLMPGPHHGHMPFIMASVPPGTMVSQVNQKMQYVKKTASNMPHQRPQQPNDIPHGIPVSMAAGHPIITQVGFQHGGQFMYPVQQGQTPQGMGPQVPIQPMPYQPPLPYQKQPPMYRPVTPQANIPNAAPHQGAQGIQPVQDGNHPQVHVVSNQAAALQAQAAQHQAAAVAMQQVQQQQQQQAQQQQQQQQQVGHFSHQQMQPHQQPGPHLQPQGHPHAQPNTTPPQQQGQHTQQGQPGPTAMQQQQQQQGQAPQHTGRPSPSPVHHLPQQITHMTQAQMQQHHPHASQQAQLLYQSSLQPTSSQPLPGQPLQSPQSLHPQHPFSGGHPPQLQLHYPPTSNIQAANITNVTPVHNHPHPHPQQAGVFYIQNPNQAGPAGGGQGGMQYPAVSGAGPHMAGPYLQAAQGNNKYWPGPGQHQQQVQYQQGN